MQESGFRRKTKIVATMGPAVGTLDKVRTLIASGVDLFRINCSHGSADQWSEYIQLIRSAGQELDRPTPIMLDLQGPKIRLGNLEHEIEVQDGQTVRFQVGDFLGTPELIPSNYPYLVQDVKVGDPLLIEDGKIVLTVRAIENEQVVCEVVAGGILKDRKGINLPESDLTAKTLSEKDLQDLAFAVAQEADFVAISFVRKAEDIEMARAHAKQVGENRIHFIAKIERREAIPNLRSILDCADGVMVARGDLGVEIGPHKVPMLQKEIISRANLTGKFVITATQMLDSMIERPGPTRAEASDVANAILDGTDACMLSGETASGGYPIEAVKMMAKIAREAENHPLYKYKPVSMPRGSVHQIPNGLAVAAYQTALLMDARLLIAFTNTGGSALSLSKKHPDPLVVGATINPDTARRMRAYWGVEPMLLESADSIDSMVEEISVKVKAAKLAMPGDVVILTFGYPLWATGSTNLMSILKIK
ncbi:MAG: pyruvate kinase [Acidobacteria bacterium]|nr:pyruvate kinase [Acidobacteriota bacterium]MCB9397044.1 pyruvate kinase [Acidobacteriota bacterium]